MTRSPQPMRRSRPRRSAPLAALFAALALLAAAPALAEDMPEPVEAETPADETAPVPSEAGAARTIRLDQGFLLDLPEGWVLEDRDADPGDATGRRAVRVVCETPACARTRETCTLRLRPRPVEGPDDAARLAGLHAAPLSRYLRLRAVLKATSAGATLRGPLGPLRLGARDWIAVETEAAPGFKSGLFAETVIGGRYLGAICKTCETGALRHAAARAFLSGARRTERTARR